MNLETLTQHATTEELRTIAAVLERANAKPAVLVTLQEGSRKRRYVVARGDEEEMRRYVGRSQTELRSGWVLFGAQWLRGWGRVDEMYRSLSMSDAVKVEEADREKVWNR